MSILIDELAAVPPLFTSNLSSSVDHPIEPKRKRERTIDERKVTPGVTEPPLILGIFFSNPPLLVIAKS